MIFWIAAQCGVVVAYQHFGGSCCLHLQYWRWVQYSPLKHWHPTTILRSVETQKTASSILW